MATKKIRFLVGKPNRDGTTRWYWQPSKALRDAGWPIRPLKDSAGNWLNESDAMILAIKHNRDLDEARAGEAPPTVSGQTLDLLIDTYEKSPRFKKLAPRTQADYKNHLKALAKWGGDQPVKAFTPGLFQDYYEPIFKETPYLANARMRVARLLFSHGVRLDMIASNPVRMPGLIGIKKKGRIWSKEEVAHMVKTAEDMKLPMMALMILLGEWTGHYPVDLRQLRLDQWNEDKNQLYLKRQKTDTPVVIELTDEIADRLAKIKQDRETATVAPLTIITAEGTNKPYSQSLFNKTFALVRDKASETMPSCKDLQFKYLRHTAVVRLAEAGATTIQIAAITAHSLKQCEGIIDTYLVRSEKMGEEAIKLRKADGQK